MFFLCFLLAVLQPQLLQSQELGKTPNSLSDSEQNWSNSDGHLQTWNGLSAKFVQTLDQQETTLRRLLITLNQSENNLKQSTDLCAQLWTQNRNLSFYCDQIAERMQERDEDLALTYLEMDRLDQKNKEQSLFITLLIVLLIGAVLIIIVPPTVRLIKKFVI